MRSNGTSDIKYVHCTCKTKKNNNNKYILFNVLNYERCISSHNLVVKSD